MQSLIKYGNFFLSMVKIRIVLIIDSPPKVVYSSKVYLLMIGYPVDGVTCAPRHVCEKVVSLKTAA